MATGADDSRCTIGDLGAPRLKRLQQAHQRISECLAEFESAGAEVGAPEVMAAPARLHAACERLHAAEREVARLYDRWEELGEGV